LHVQILLSGADTRVSYFHTGCYSNRFCSR
jgi:hypothetical protein